MLGKLIPHVNDNKTLHLTGSAAAKFALLNDASQIPLGADGSFTLLIPEGERQASFGLWAKADIGAAETIGLSAQLIGADGQTIYRTLFRSQLDDEALADLRLALSQGQPLGDTRFSEAICAAAGVRRTQARRGRPAREREAEGADGTQTDFGF
jgi:hypothetical protein